MLLDGGRRSEAQPRVAVLGTYRDALGLPHHALRDLIGDHVEAGYFGARSNLEAMSAAARAVADGFEMVHLLDARLAPAGLLIRMRHGLPVSVTAGADAVSGRNPSTLVRWYALNRLDQAFAADANVVQRLRARAPRLPVARTPAGARTPPPPRQEQLDRVSRALRGLMPGRLVIGLPWLDDRDCLRWYRDAVAPLLAGNPLTLIFGAPSRREGRILFGANGMRDSYRVVNGRLDGGMLAAMARCVDVFALPGDARPAHATTDLALALAASGAPVVAGGSLHTLPLMHEREAFVATAADPMSFVATLNQLLALPAVQRHELGIQFAAAVREFHTWAPAAELYGERFAALVGRPRIPVNLRAA